MSPELVFRATIEASRLRDKALERVDDDGRDSDEDQGFEFHNWLLSRMNLGRACTLESFGN
jgi:hypothetical protein